jgi:hypothetical protein
MIFGERLAAITFFWHGWRPIYRASHVNAWARQVKKHLPEADRIICITDMPKGITECETYPLWSIPNLRVVNKRGPNCFLRLKLFDPSVGSIFGDRLLLLDLDAVLRRPLAPILTQDSFRALKGYVSEFNGSMWMLKVGEHADVWRTFDPKNSPSMLFRARAHGARLIGSDQAWMSIKLKGNPMWTPEEHGVMQFMRINGDDDVKDARAVFFAGPDKPWSQGCAEKTPQLHAEYMQFMR